MPAIGRRTDPARPPMDSMAPSPSFRFPRSRSPPMERPSTARSSSASRRRRSTRWASTPSGARRTGFDSRSASRVTWRRPQASGRGGVRLGPDPPSRQRDAASPKQRPMSRRCRPRCGRRPGRARRDAPGPETPRPRRARGRRWRRWAVQHALQERFDHWQHRALFPTCIGCHAGAEDSSRSLWPQPSDCTVCHDGAVEKTVEWAPPGAPRASNLRFTHSGPRSRTRALPRRRFHAPVQRLPYLAGS